MGEERFVGTWALVATEWRRADGRHANPFGDGAIGILTYDEAGHVSAQIMRADRPSPAVTHAGIDTAAATAVPGYIAYFGTFDIDRAARVVTHHVLASAFPAWVGQDHARSFSFEGDRLTLSADVVSADGVAVAAATTWQRVA
jgi:hypothetical protein